MSKSTFLFYHPAINPERLVSVLRPHGFFQNGKAPETLYLDGNAFFDLTISMDDSGNGFCDAQRFEQQSISIERRAERKKRAGWSQSKVERWKAEMEKEHLAEMLQGAEKWLKLMRILLNEFGLTEIALMGSINSQQEGAMAVVGSQKWTLSELAPLDLIQLELNVVHFFR